MRQILKQINGRLIICIIIAVCGLGSYANELSANDTKIIILPNEVIYRHSQNKQHLDSLPLAEREAELRQIACYMALFKFVERNDGKWTLSISRNEAVEAGMTGDEYDATIEKFEIFNDSSKGLTTEEHEFLKERHEKFWKTILENDKSSSDVVKSKE